MVNHSHSEASTTLLTARIGPNGVAAPITMAHAAAGIAVTHVDPPDAAVQDRMADAQARARSARRAHTIATLANIT